MEVGGGYNSISLLSDTYYGKICWFVFCWLHCLSSNNDDDDAVKIKFKIPTFWDVFLMMMVCYIFGGSVILVVGGSVVK